MVDSCSFYLIRKNNISIYRPHKYKLCPYCNKPVLQLRIRTPIGNQAEEHLCFCQCYSDDPCPRKKISVNSRITDCTKLSFKKISCSAQSVELCLHSVFQEPLSIRVNHWYCLRKSQLVHQPILYISKALQDEIKARNSVRT